MQTSLQTAFTNLRLPQGRDIKALRIFDTTPLRCPVQADEKTELRAQDNLDENIMASHCRPKGQMQDQASYGRLLIKPSSMGIGEGSVTVLIDENYAAGTSLQDGRANIR